MMDTANSALSSWESVKKYHSEANIPSRAKARAHFAAFMARLNSLVKKPFRREISPMSSWQGLKPNYELIGFIGLTEVMPLLQSLRKRTFGRVFHQAVKSCPFKAAI